MLSPRNPYGRYYGTKRRRSPRRGGTAVVEFAVCIPLLALVLVVTFFFGWAMMNQQHVWVSDRYACWHQVRTGWHRDSTGWHQDIAVATPSDEQINLAFFGGKALNVRTGRDSGSLQTEQEFVNVVGQDNAAAGDMARDLVLNQFPEGLGVSVQGEFPTTVQFWQHFTGAIRSRDAREGVEWRWGQAACANEVADKMLQPVDGFLAAMPAPSNNMAQFFRMLYRGPWVYYDGWPYPTDANGN